MKPADVSVVIPTRNEEEAVGESVQSALAAGAVEVIVSDGGSDDATVSAATAAGATKIVHSPPGRGTQLNYGTKSATKPFVLFLHADNRLGTECLRQICDCPNVVWGAFRQQIQSRRLIYRIVERGNALRVRLRQMPFGDQAIFVKQSILHEAGGIAELPLMEDVELAKRLRRFARPVLLDGPLMVDARRWQHRGVIRQTAKNWSIQTAYALGVSAERVSKWYR